MINEIKRSNESLRGSLSLSSLHCKDLNKQLIRSPVDDLFNASQKRDELPGECEQLVRWTGTAAVGVRCSSRGFAVLVML